MITTEQLQSATQVVGPQKVAAMSWYVLSGQIDLSGGGVSVPAPVNLGPQIEYVYLVMPTWAAIGYLQQLLYVEVTGKWDCPTAQAWAKYVGEPLPSPLSVAQWLGQSKTLKDVAVQKTGKEPMTIFFTTSRNSVYRPPQVPAGCAVRLPPPAPPPPKLAEVAGPLPVVGPGGVVAGAQGTLGFVPGAALVPGPVDLVMSRLMAGEQAAGVSSGAGMLIGGAIGLFSILLVAATLTIGKRA